MEFDDTISTHLPPAVVAATVVALFTFYTGEVTTLAPLVVYFIAHFVALFVGFVGIETLWKTVFDERET